MGIRDDPQAIPPASPGVPFKPGNPWRFQSENRPRAAAAIAPPRAVSPPAIKPRFARKATNRAAVAAAKEAPPFPKLPKIYTPCSICVQGNRKNGDGKHNQAGMRARIWHVESGRLAGEVNLCKTCYAEFRQMAAQQSEYRFEYTTELRPGI